MINKRLFYFCKFCNKKFPLIEKKSHEFNCLSSKNQIPNNCKLFNNISQNIIQNISNRQNIPQFHINNNNKSYSNGMLLYEICGAELNINKRDDYLTNHFIQNDDNNSNFEFHEEEIFNNDGILISQNIQSNYNSPELINIEENIQYSINYANNTKLINTNINNDIISNLNVNKINDNNKNFSERICIICQENYKIGDNYIILPCIHLFHENCIKTWIKNQRICPICKRKLNKKD